MSPSLCTCAFLVKFTIFIKNYSFRKIIVQNYIIYTFLFVRKSTSYQIERGRLRILDSCTLFGHTDWLYS